MYIHTYIQWRLSIEGTTGTQLTVLYREVFLIQRKIWISHIKEYRATSTYF